MLDSAFEILQGYISPDILWMIPSLMIVGRLMKKSCAVYDEMIPRVLFAMGAFLCLIRGFDQTPPENLTQKVLLIVSCAGQGFLVGAVAVGLNQFFKQEGKYKLLKSWDGLKAATESATEPPQEPQTETGIEEPAEAQETAQSSTGEPCAATGRSTEELIDLLTRDLELREKELQQREKQMMSQGNMMY